METKLCCLINPEVKCRECYEAWCEACWFEGEEDTSHTNKKALGGWGKCPKVNKTVRWGSSSYAPPMQYIVARDDDSHAE